MDSGSIGIRRGFPDLRRLSGSTVILDIDGAITADAGAEISRGTLNSQFLPSKSSWARAESPAGRRSGADWMFAR